MVSLFETSPTIATAWAQLLGAAQKSKHVTTVRVVGSAFRSNLAKEHVYISSAITSGNRLYDVAEELGITPQELMADKDTFNNRVKQPNIKDAIALAEQWQKKTGGVVVSPAIFEARELGWGQDDYMNLWLMEHIIPQTTKMVMMDGWQYSNGAVKEYLTALLMKAGYHDRQNIDIVDEQGKTLPFDVAYELLTEAAYKLNNVGMPPKTQAHALHVIALLNLPASKPLKTPVGYADLLDFDRDHYQAVHTKAEAFLYEMQNTDLLDTVEPTFVDVGGTGKLQHKIPEASVQLLASHAGEGAFAAALQALQAERKQSVAI